MTILYVTSFNHKLWDVSGRHLLDSWQNTKSEGTFFIGYEGNLEGLYDYYDPIVNYDLADSSWLNKWLLDNKDISPPIPCGCLKPWAHGEKSHVKNCKHTYFRRNAYRWVRKIATLKHALEYCKDKKFDKIIWLDCDVIFLQKLREISIRSIFQTNKIDYDCLYLKGVRKVLEAGFVGYNLSFNGAKLITDLKNIYESGRFRNLIRWDDCYSLQKLMVNYKTRDINHELDWSNHSDVFKYSEIGKYFQHFKGKHSRILGIFK